MGWSIKKPLGDKGGHIIGAVVDPLGLLPNSGGGVAGLINMTKGNTGQPQQADPNLTYQDVLNAIGAYNVGSFNSFMSDVEMSDYANKVLQYANKDNYQDIIANGMQNKFVEWKQNPTISPEKMAGYTQSINQVYQSTLGRDATPDEISYFAKHLATGETPYELQQVLKNSPEYQQAQATLQENKYKTEAAAAREQLNTDLLRQQQEAFAKATPDIIASFQRAGRLGSSGLDAALAKAQRDLESQRQAQIANLAYQDAVRGSGYNREDFLNSQKSAFDQYIRNSQPSYNTALDLAKLSYTTPLNAGTDYLNRYREKADYAQQQSDYNRYLSEQRKAQRESDLYGLFGNILGAGIKGGMAAL